MERVADVRRRTSPTPCRRSPTCPGPSPEGRRHALARRRGAAAADPRGRCSTRTSSSARTGSARSPAATSTQPCVFDWGGQRYEVQLPAGRVGHRHVRRQLQLARPGVVPDEPRDPARAAAAAPLLRRPAQGRVPDRLRARDEPARGRGRDRRPPDARRSPRTSTGAGRCSAGIEKFQTDPHWHDLLLFHEYFHGDNGAGIGASHQTGWTGHRGAALPAHRACACSRGDRRRRRVIGASCACLAARPSTRSTPRSGCSGSAASAGALRSTRCPRAEWDALAALPVDAVWLMGVWQRSPAGLRIALADPALDAANRAALPDLRAEDVIGSPYCVRDYVVDERFGGPGGAGGGARAARRARARADPRLRAQPRRARPSVDRPRAPSAC